MAAYKNFVVWRVLKIKMFPKILRAETLCKYSLEILYALRQSVGLNVSTVPTQHIG